MTPHSGTPFPARLSIDLAAIAGNWRHLAALGAAECGAVVKADAYGLGMEEVAPVLAKAGCRSFFVAFIEEAVALRQLLGAGPAIYVMCASRWDLPGLYTAHTLVPVISSTVHAEAWGGEGVLDDLPFLAQVETGMHRLGIPAGDAAGVLANPTCLGVMSHLACADGPAADLNRRQLRAFREICAQLPDTAIRSLANSAGMYLGRDWHFGLTRPGIALYGGNPQPGRPNPMAGVVTLEAPILQLVGVPAGQTVGYGGTFTARRDSLIATVPMGYADGLSRHLSSRGQAVIAGYEVPYAGRVSMDMLALDVTDVPPAVLAGDPAVQLIGPDMPIDVLADTAGTISYELLTHLGRRCRRHYVGGTAEA